MNDRAVSETLGFVLAFALVVGTVGAVYTFGIDGLQDAQQDEQINNAARAFDVLADNMADVYLHGAPSRATEISLAGATLSIGDPITVTVTAVNTSDPLDNTSVSMHPRPLVYSGIQDSRLVYVGGSVLRSDRDASVMLIEPGWIVTRRTAVIPFVHTYPTGGITRMSGDSTVLVVAHRQSNQLVGQLSTEMGPGNPDARVNVTVESPRAIAWKRYFEAQGYDAIDGDVTDETITYQFTTDRVYVSETTVELRLRR